MNNIRTLRQLKGWSASELAKLIDVAAEGTIRHWEKGRRIPDSDTAMKLAKIFGVSVDEVLGVQPQAILFNGNILKEGIVMPRTKNQVKTAKPPVGINPDGLLAYEIQENIDQLLKQGRIIYVRPLEIGEDPTNNLVIAETAKGAYFGNVTSTDKAGYFNIKPYGSKKTIDNIKVNHIYMFAGLMD